MFRDFNKYEVYEDGRIWSYKSNKWMKPTQHPKGYLQICLMDNDGNSKTYRHHRVVYEACTQQPIPEGMQVNHIDEDKTNNHMSNLNLMSQKENINWGTGIERRAKANTNNPLLSKQVEQYDKEGNLINVWVSANEVQRQLGYSQGNISECCNGKRKSANGFKWRYAS